MTTFLVRVYELYIGSDYYTERFTGELQQETERGQPKRQTVHGYLYPNVGYVAF